MKICINSNNELYSIGSKCLFSNHTKGSKIECNFSIHKNAKYKIFPSIYNRYRYCENLF